MNVKDPWNMGGGFTPLWLSISMISAISVGGVYIMHPPTAVLILVMLIGVAVSATAILLAAYQSRNSVITDRDVLGNYDKLSKFNMCPRCKAPAVEFNMGVTRNKQYVEYECMAKLYLKKATKHMIVSDHLEPGIPGVCEPDIDDVI